MVCARKRADYVQKRMGKKYHVFVEWPLKMHCPKVVVKTLVNLSAAQEVKRDKLVAKVMRELAEMEGMAIAGTSPRMRASTGIGNNLLIGINVLDGPGFLNKRQRECVQYGYWRLGQLFPPPIGDHSSLNFQDDRHGGTKYHITRNEDGTYTFVSGLHSYDWGKEPHLAQCRYLLEIALFEDEESGETDE
jgi:hypothetical protein